MKLKIGEMRESRDIGVVWPVLEDHGKCGCGQCDMTRPVAFFINREDAERWIHPPGYSNPVNATGHRLMWLLVLRFMRQMVWQHTRGIFRHESPEDLCNEIDALIVSIEEK